MPALKRIVATGNYAVRNMTVTGIVPTLSMTNFEIVKMVTRLAFLSNFVLFSRTFESNEHKLSKYVCCLTATKLI